jgi:geranylgeranyl diphosphate synthase type I
MAVVDVALPGISGLELCRRLRRRFPGMKVVLISMFDEPEWKAEAARAGASAYLLKDLPAEEILAALRRVANGGKPPSRRGAGFAPHRQGTGSGATFGPGEENAGDRGAPFPVGDDDPGPQGLGHAQARRPLHPGAFAGGIALGPPSQPQPAGAMILERYRTLIAEGLTRVAGLDGPLGLLVRYPLGLSEADGRPGPGIGGKLLRPSLVLFSCEALGGKPEKALPLACALELIHNFSLVHDDIQDGDEFRRGRPTAWKVFGLGQAINSGDALLVLALDTALSADLPDETKVLAQKALLSATLRMIEGQVLDLSAEGKPLSVEGYLEMARRKTGALLGCALELGALAGGRPDLRELSLALGEELGLAFQIRDDILGIWGDPGENGKARGKRSSPKKAVFPCELCAREGSRAFPPPFRAGKEHGGNFAEAFGGGRKGSFGNGSGKAHPKGCGDRKKASLGRWGARGIPRASFVFGQKGGVRWDGRFP